MPENLIPQAKWAGWSPALQYLESKPGTLWIISPFITTVPAEKLIRGARILTTLEAKHVARGAIQPRALAELIIKGAEVRILDDLHAKVYMRMNGSEAVGFSGSANLTHRGEDRNHEVMSGPENFSARFLQDLTSFWSRAEQLTLAEIERIEQEAARLQENIETREYLESDVVVIIVETKLMRGSFELSESKIGIPKSERIHGLHAARVDFVKAEDRKQGTQFLRKGLKQIQSGKYGKSQNLARLSYAVPIREMDIFQDGIEKLHEGIRVFMQEFTQANREAWKVKFLDNLRRASEKYVKATPEQVNAIMQEGTRRFDEYIKNLDVGLSYGIYLPLQTPSRPLAHDFQTQFKGVRESQLLNWD